jgi:DNA-binding HxlR family transcriptional regulator
VAMTTIQESKMSPPIFIARSTPKVLFSLREKPYRPGQLRRQLGSVPQRMLRRTLRNLEATGVIARRATGAKTIAVEYSLTRLGRTLIAPLKGMCRWAKRYRKGRECRRVPVASLPGTKGETLEVSLYFRGFERKTIQKGEQYEHHQ